MSDAWTLAGLALGPSPGMTLLAAIPAHGLWGGPIVATCLRAIMFLAPAMGVGNAVWWIGTGDGHWGYQWDG